MTPSQDLARRDFLRLTAAAGGGLLVAVALPGCEWRGAVPVELERFNTFLAIGTDGSVTVTIPVPEIGQGVRTSLAMLIAEELEADWDRVGVVQADAGDDLGPWPLAGGSNSVRAHWMPLRQAGAAARYALVHAAAARFGVSAAECEARQGEVLHPASRRRLGFGSLAADAALVELPEEIPLKDPADFSLIGTPRSHLGAAAIANGSATFGLDVRVPGMVRAVIARPPSYGGSARSWDDAATLTVPGVSAVVAVPAGSDPERPGPRGGVAVIADSTWAALQGRAALQVDWEPGPNAGESTERLHRICQDLLGRRGETYREEGMVDAAIARSAYRVTAEYHAPFLAHVAMEPMNCVVDLREDRCEIWAPTQVPNAIRAGVARQLDLPPESVIVHVPRVGGGFGRRLLGDFVLEALPIARAAGRPVQVVWTREDDIQHGYFRPFSYHRLEAGLDGVGNVTSWLHRQAGTSRYEFQRRPNPAGSEFGPGTWPAALVPAHRLEYAQAESNLPLGALRAPGANAFTFATECFLDEVAHAAGRDPLEFRLALLGEARDLPNDRDNPVFSTARMRGVLELATERAGWGRQLPAGSGLGIAGCFAFGSYSAHVVEVSVDAATGAVQVARVFSAVDCGRAVNPNGVQAQVEGGVVDGLGAAFAGEITVEAGGVQQSNFHDYPLLRLPQSPSVEVAIVPSTLAPTGVGEVPYPPVLPALANAVFAACGARVRQLPLTAERVRQALG